MAKYKVYYSGFFYVEADSMEEAEELYDTNYIYEEEHIDGVEEVDEFDVDLW